MVEMLILSLCLAPVLYLLRWGTSNGKMGHYHYQLAKMGKNCCKNEPDLLKIIKQKSHEPEQLNETKVSFRRSSIEDGLLESMNCHRDHVVES